MSALVANKFPNLSLIPADCTCAVASRPEAVADQFLGSPVVSSVDMNRRLPLQLSNRVGYAERRRDAQSHMHMVGESMTLDQFQSELLTQFSEYSTNLFPQSSKDRFLPIVGNEHDMAPAVPTYVRLIFPFSHRLTSSTSRRVWGGEPISSYFGNPGSVEPFRVTPPEVVV